MMRAQEPESIAAGAFAEASTKASAEVSAGSESAGAASAALARRWRCMMSRARRASAMAGDSCAVCCADSCSTSAGVSGTASFVVSCGAFGAGEASTATGSEDSAGCSAAFLRRANISARLPRTPVPVPVPAPEPAPAPAPALEPAPLPPVPPCPFSRASTRCARASTVMPAAGSAMRAHRISSNSRGAVAPRICASPSFTRDAQRVSVACPIFSACSRSTSRDSSGAFTSPRSNASGTACTTSRSRKRSSRSSLKRRGSYPASITSSTTANSAAESCSASASTARSIRVESVTPSKASARL